MKGIPNELASQILNARYPERQRAWARLDAEGKLNSAGGNWKHFGWEVPIPGQSIEEHLPGLAGLLPLEHAQTLAALEVAPGVSADLVIVPENDGVGIWLEDVSARVAQQGRMQQEGNQLSLVNARLTGKAFGSALPAGEDLLSLLKMAVFERDASGQARVLGVVPPWAEPFVETLGPTELVGGQVLAEGDGLGFLDNFLIEAGEFWDAGQPGHLASGVWCEATPGRDDLCFEALAILDEAGREGLVIERVDVRFAERQSILQRARQSHLDLETLRSEIHKKEVLLQCIVHDLRGPLSNMMAVMSLLNTDTLPAEKQQELLGLAKKHATRQDQMMREILGIFAAEVEALQSFETDPESAPDLLQVVRDRAQALGPRFDAERIPLKVSLPKSPGAPRSGNGQPDARTSNGTVPVAADVSRLGRVIENLLGNALRHSPPGEAVEVEVSSITQEDQPYWEMRVLDRGPGVPEPMRAKIFDRFVQGGTDSGVVGLGLYFCRNSLQSWGGSCGYRDRKGGGAEFWIRLMPATAAGGAAGTGVDG